MIVATVMEKLRTIVLGNVHAFLDAAIDASSIPAIKQNIRDMEEAIETLETEAINAEGEMNVAKEKQTTLQAQADELNTNIDLILGDGDETNDSQAVLLEARLTGVKEALDAANEEVATYKETMDSVDKVVNALKAKLEVMMRQLGVLEAQEKTSGAKKKAAEAIQAAIKLTGAQTSIDNVAQRVNKKSHIADAKLRRAMGGMESSLDEDKLLADARAKIEARKAALKNKEN